MNPIRVMIVEDHPILADGLRRLLDEVPNIQVIAQSLDADTALEWLSENTCDVLLLDIGLPGRDGFWLMEALAERQRKVATLVLTMHKDKDVILRAMDLGAAGYLVKSVEADELARAIATVAAGSSYGDRYVKEAVANKLKSGHLSPEIVLFAGDIVAVWPYFSGILAEELPKTLNAKLPRIITTADCGMARLRGALSLVLQQHFSPSTSRSVPRRIAMNS